MLSTSNPVQCRCVASHRPKPRFPPYRAIVSPRATATPCRDLLPGYAEEFWSLDISLRVRDSPR